MRSFSLRSALIAIAVALAVPVAVFVAVLINQLNTSDQAALERQTHREVNAISATVALILNDMMSTLDLVASAPDLETGELREVHYRTSLILAGAGKFVIVVDEDGRQLLNTRVPFEEASGTTSDMDSFRTALETGLTVVSNVFFGRTSEKFVFNVVKPLPVSQATNARGVIITKNASEIDEALGSQDIPEGWNVAVVDAQGVIVAAFGNPDLVPGSPLGVVSKIPKNEISGVFRDEDSGDLFGFAKVSTSGWAALKWGPMQSVRPSLLQNWLFLLTSGAVLLALLIAVSLFVAEALSSAISKLANMAAHVGNGEVVSPSRSPIREIDAVAIALSNASFERSEAEQRTRVVMGELAHRTKNLMAVLLSMIRQTARHQTDTEAMATVLGNRVMALGASLDLLTRDAVGRVSLRELVSRQLETFSVGLGNVAIEGDPIDISGDFAQQLGMALHEMATNATKYGALSRREGRISISWNTERPDDAETAVLKLNWKETGGPPVSPPQSTGFGQVILKDHIQSVTKGTVQVDYHPTGFEWTLCAPLSSVVPDQPKP
ncbi:HWE histidine kinase domain-containing protein [Roseibium sp. M-1]